jgi:hypothetical protein
MDPLPPQYDDFTTDPYSGLMVPKSLQSNVTWRKKVLKQASSSASLRRSLKLAFAKSPIYWLNLVGWTFLQKKVNDEGREGAVLGDASNVPFITWKIQDESLQQIISAIETGNDVVIDKARDMGATWLVIAAFQWYFQFRSNTTFLELSRKESLVDRQGDMDSLFEKHRYLLRMQPEWLRPKTIIDKKLHLGNGDNGSTIEGESTNKNAGQASRKTAIFLDEFARVAEGEEIDLATADTSACRIFNSTPSGPNTQFTRILKAVRAGTREAKIITLPFERHPQKGKDAYVTEEEGKAIWTSPWREIQKLRRSKANVAQNIDRKHGRAGDSFFDSDEVEKHRRDFERAPLDLGNIAFDVDVPQDVKFSYIRKMDARVVVWVPNGGRKPWRLWVPLIGGRPNQLTRYIFGVDISAGSGASNSVITVLDHSTGMIVAKFWDAFTSPEELAEIVSFAGIWFGGTKSPLVVFEKNGPGIIFGKKLLTLGYPTIYYQKVDGLKVEQATRRWGWASSPARKEMLLGMYREALKLGSLINPCKEALDEALDYVYDDHGRIEPGTVGSEEGGGGALHGDHVIADALVLLGRADMPKVERDQPTRAPAGSYGDRLAQHKKRSNDRLAWSR